MEIRERAVCTQLLETYNSRIIQESYMKTPPRKIEILYDPLIPLLLGIYLENVETLI